MLNKNIWLLWLQGWENTPWLVKQVAESWEINNPDWNVVYVTLENIHEYVNDIDYIYDDAKKISPQHKADIIRLSLLKNHGGVWADASTLCMQPLDTWAEEAVRPAGFWMYHGHGGGMSCRNGPSIWLILSEKESLIISKWKSACDNYWNTISVADSYFWLDKLFRDLTRTDIVFQNQWNLTPYLYSELKGKAHTLAPYNHKLEKSNQAIKEVFLKSPPYVLKLSWKRWQKNFLQPDSTESLNSNGYFAIQMSKRRFSFKHRMTLKNSFFVYVKSPFWDIRYTIKRTWFRLNRFLHRQKFKRMS